MRATELLLNEHRVIERVMECLGCLCEQALSRKRVDGEKARMVLDFFRQFGERVHQAKEESCLFPWLESHGFSRQADPIQEIMHGHEVIHRHLQAMDAVLPEAAKGHLSAVQHFVAQAFEFLDLLELHLTKEERTLYPMAERTLTVEDQAQISKAFNRLGLAQAEERYLEMAQDLVEHFQAGTESCMV